MLPLECFGPRCRGCHSRVWPKKRKDPRNAFIWPSMLCRSQNGTEATTHKPVMPMVKHILRLKVSLPQPEKAKPPRPRLQRHTGRSFLTRRADRPSHCVNPDPVAGAMLPHTGMKLFANTGIKREMDVTWLLTLHL